MKESIRIITELTALESLGVLARTQLGRLARLGGGVSFDPLIALDATRPLAERPANLIWAGRRRKTTRSAQRAVP